MQKTLTSIVSLALVVGAFLLSGRADAQVQLNINGNYFAPTESGSSFSDGLWGGGATLRYFISPKFAVGINGRYFRRSETADLGGVSATVEANLLMVTGQAEYFFTESGLRPYVGIEAGLYRQGFKFDVPGLGAESDNLSNFGVAPKLGIQFDISPAFGINADAGYHIIFIEGESGKSLLLGAGVFFKFGQN